MNDSRTDEPLQQRIKELNEENQKQMETIDICVTARYKDKEVAIVDLLKALFKDNEELRKENKKLKEIESMLNNSYENAPHRMTPLELDILKILKGEE